jgi:predicted lipoprotein with Yx(FWY)xxD motif
MNRFRIVAMAAVAALGSACAGSNGSASSSGSASGDMSGSSGSPASGSVSSTGIASGISGAPAGSGQAAAQSGSALVGQSGVSSGLPSSGTSSDASSSGVSTPGEMDASSGVVDAGPTSVILENTAKGEIVADAKGLALYVYKSDTPGSGNTAPKSACTGGCATAWPPFDATPLTVPAGLSATDFGSFDRGGGVMQSTYMGWPLYLYRDDMKAGDVKGDGESGLWFALKIPFTPPK